MEEKEQVFTRESFVQATGVFISHVYFFLISQEYESSGLNQEDFIKKWLAENQEHIVTCPMGDFQFTFYQEDIGSANPALDASDPASVIDSLSMFAYYWYKKYMDQRREVNLLQSAIHEVRLDMDGTRVEINTIRELIADQEARSNPVSYYALHRSDSVKSKLPS